ncbi:MAG: PEP/pyruvate-binding domain-containing protein [Candidatus Taylorbacteria bacterium]
MKILKDFSKINKNDSAIAGGKGASLGEMTSVFAKATTGQASWYNPVPPGFVLLANAFERFLEETDLNVEIDTILHTVQHREIHTVDSASEKIQALVKGAKMPEDIAKEIKSSFKKLGAKFVAVRSSATAEDSTEAAWAGQLDSYLNTTEKNVLEKVQHCWASLFTPRAIFYRFELHDKNRGTDQTRNNTRIHTKLEKVSVAVVIQKMVESEVSGIAFSVHPVTQDYNQLIIEAGLGLGEAIVSGQITPDSYVVEKNPRRIIDKNISTQERGLFRASLYPSKVKLGSHAQNEWLDIPKEKGGLQKLSDKQILELSELVLKIEKHYGFPCDIEWAFALGKFYITQSRPITTLAPKPKTPDSKAEKKGETKEAVWVENFSADACGYELVSAFLEFGMWDFQRIIFGKKSPLVISDCFIDCKGIAVAGFYPENQIREIIDRLMNLIYSRPQKIQKNHKESYVINDKYVAYAKKCFSKNFKALTNGQLSKLFIDLIVWQEKAHQHSLGSTWYVDSHGGTFANSVLEKTKALVTLNNSKLNPAEVFTTLTTPEAPSSGLQEELESLGILEKINADKKVKAIFRNLKDYSKIPEELQASMKNAISNHHEKWQWIPFGYMGPAYGVDYYLAVWAGLIRENLDVKKTIEKLRNRPKEIKSKKRELIKELTIPKDLQRIYELAADITFLKGYRKDSSYFGFFVLEKIFREISKRLGLSILETHLLLHTEIRDLLMKNRKADKKEIERRKKHAVIILKDGKLVVLSGEKADEFMKLKKIKKEVFESGADSFKGTCACAGYAKGMVKIVNKPDEMHKMNQGDIMVSHTTFPSLVPAMKKASAIVTEDGGITCHAAIVARELGTPCVTGIKVATQVFKDGDEIEVKADDGIVRRIQKKK